MTAKPKAALKPWLMTFTASIMALSLAACQTEAPPPPPAPPPPAPAGPPVSLAPGISDAASIYVAYIDSARKMGTDFADGAMVQTKLQQGASYEPKQLGRGAIAYAAIVAMQEPAFRSQLRGYAADETARRDLVNKILANPAYAATIPGANIAARRVILALSSDGEMLYARGSAVKQNAYTIQKQAWSKGVVTDPAARLTATKMSSTTTRGVVSDESSRLLVAALTGEGLITKASTGGATGETAIGVNVVPSSDASSAQGASSGAGLTLDEKAIMPANFDRETLFNQPYTPGVNRALAIAAISILGEGTGANEEAVTAMLNDGASPRCLGESKLMLNQCLAASRFHFDDVFCIGQHILMDTGNCIGELSSNALDLTPKRQVAYNADGTEQMKYVNAKPYITPPPVKKTSAKASTKTATKTPAKAPAKKKS
ncbi:hypothetical protein PQU92_11130 [Asticcacaulis sp. BYS171W]|uniref:Uncharacterized protein n=1 Tax=Asticcacaulis aquaticus TaxID=2984212 RepID=A0ABT5HUT8_9CAUL|nr:hypothetical protein [Asticcacaulis aquaticus]MDC7683833.1 hypothetical protein [Asticcacaulis aquaticus]